MKNYIPAILFGSLIVVLIISFSGMNFVDTPDEKLTREENTSWVEMDPELEAELIALDKKINELYIDHSEGSPTAQTLVLIDYKKQKLVVLFLDTMVDPTKKLPEFINHPLIEYSTYSQMANCNSNGTLCQGL